MLQIEAGQCGLDWVNTDIDTDLYSMQKIMKMTKMFSPSYRSPWNHQEFTRVIMRVTGLIRFSFHVDPVQNYTLEPQDPTALKNITQGRRRSCP
jgi:hypothetical protein